MRKCNVHLALNETQNVTVLCFVADFFRTEKNCLCQEISWKFYFKAAANFDNEYCV